MLKGDVRSDVGLTCEAPLGLFQVLLRMLKKAKSRVSVRLTKLTKKVFFELTKQNYISPEKTALTSNTLLRFSFFHNISNISFGDVKKCQDHKNDKLNKPEGVTCNPNIPLQT